jgi:hypothetical protein
MCMENVLHFFTPALLFITGVLGMQGDTAGQQVVVPVDSVEVGLSETSPNGPAGGFAMPASGCSAPTVHDDRGIHDCDGLPEIEVDPPIIRVGETANVSWDPKPEEGLTNCVVSGGSLSAGLVTETGDEDVSPSADTRYYIDCDNNRSDSTLLRVLPEIQET